jgi:hypothetical protein
MADVRQYPGFEIGRPAQVLGPFIELHVQCHHPAVGLLQFLIEPLDLQLPLPRFIQGSQELLVLPLNLLGQVQSGSGFQLRADLCHGVGDQDLSSSRQALSHEDVGPGARARDLEMIGETPGAADPKPQP